MSSFEARNVNHPEYREPLNEIKYEHIRNAIVRVLSRADDRGLTFDQLVANVEAHVTANDVPRELFPKPGSVRWYTKAVQLDLEARGTIQRIPGERPLRFRLIEL